MTWLQWFFLRKDVWIPFDIASVTSLTIVISIKNKNNIFDPLKYIP